MTKEPKHTDVSHTPELLRLAEEVQRTQEARVLVTQAEKLAVLMPSPLPLRLADHAKLPGDRPTPA
jgi:hypothetical protein